MGKRSTTQAVLGGVLQSALDQKWNAAGQRTMLKNLGRPIDYGHRVTNRLASVTGLRFHLQLRLWGKRIAHFPQ